jgi:hypothetical protein
MSGLLGFTRALEGSCLRAWCTARTFFDSRQLCHPDHVSVRAVFGCLLLQAGWSAHPEGITTNCQPSGLSLIRAGR